MDFNFIAVFVAALIPMLLGFVWYHPRVLGTAWMAACGFTEEDLKGANMAVVFGVSFVLSLLLAVEVNLIVIHQMHIASAMMDMANPDAIKDVNTAIGADYASFMDKYGLNFRTFRHGVLHGVLTGIFLILPVMGTNALFERKGWKYILINVGYWTVCLAIMGGIICTWV